MIKEDLERHGLSCTYNEVLIKLSSMNCALDFVIFPNPVHIKATLSKIKISIEVKVSTIPGYDKDLWC